MDQELTGAPLQINKLTLKILINCLSLNTVTIVIIDRVK
jgi:hypothetical protein